MGFTDFLQRGEEDSSSGKMLRFLTITALVAAATASHMLAKKIHKDMLVMNSMTACWGKGNMLAFKVGMKKAMETCMNENHSGLLKPANPLLALLSQNADTLPFPTNDNPFQSLPAQINQNPFKSSNVNLGAWNKLWNSRNKRQVEGLLQPTEEDFKEFLMDFEDFKGDIASKMGNLTCVMKKMDMLDNNLQVNMKAYSGDMWNKIDLSQTMAGEDAEWRNMLETHYKDCYDIARSFPQSALNRNPLTKVFGRHMVFFKCAKKAEAKCCGMACANDMLETLYGKNDNYDWTQHGMPANKYERAAWTMKVMYGTASPEEGAIHEFFFSDPMM